jgi:seryl-tRNA synthetase
VPDFKGEKVVLPGHEIPKGFVSSDRIKQLEGRGKICSESAYTKSQAASGVVPVIDAAGKIKALEINVKQLESTNKELTDAVAASTDNAAAVKIEELEKTIEGLEVALKEATKKGDK